MTGEDMLFNLIIAANQAVLDELKVVILQDDLLFAYPDVEINESYNTRVGATAIKGMTQGTQTYYYSRLDITQAFADLGYDEVTVDIDTDVNIVTLLKALKLKHNLDLNFRDVQNYKQDGDIVTFDIHPRHFAYTGSLTVRVSEDSPYLATQFPNNVLSGLYGPYLLSGLVTDLSGFDPED